MTKRTAILLSTLATAVLLPLAARAELPERKSPLADAPAVRRRFELRQGRFEIGPGVTTTVGQDFYHAVMVGGKASLHLTDWISVAGVGAFNVTKSFKTSFHDRLEGVLNATSNDRTPTLTEAQNGMNKIAWTAAGQLELSPFSGKYSLFGKIFANYDFYGFGGIGLINFTADREACTDAEQATALMAGRSISCPVVGLKLGPTFGIGVHTFLGDFVSLNFEVRDILIRNNPAGRDETGDRVANAEDYSWDSNYMVGLNVTLFLPSKISISD